MFKSWKHLIAVTLASLALGGGARADFIVTTISDVDKGSGGTASNVNALVGTSAGNFDFGNTIGSTTGGSAVGDTRQVVSVGVDVLSGGLKSFGGGNTGATYNGNPIVVVTAVQGTATVTALGGGTQFKVESGKIGFFQTDANFNANFNQFNPLTWQATDATGATLKTPLAVFKLVDPSGIVGFDVLQGTKGDGGNVLSANNNLINFQTQNPTNNTGDFTFKETSIGSPGAAFIQVSKDGLFPGNTDLGDALHIFINQVLAKSTSNDPNDAGNKFRFVDPDGSNGVKGLAALNTIATNLGGLSFFASGFGSGTNTFDPYGGPSGNPQVFPGSGDLGANFGLTGFPGILQEPPPPIPEPASMVLWSVLGVGAMYGAYRRRRTATLTAQ